MRTWTVDDVMTREVVAVPETASYRDVVDLLIGHRFSAVPVVEAAVPPTDRRRSARRHDRRSRRARGAR